MDSAPSEPVGEQGYAAILLRETGVEIDLRALALRAAADARDLEARMNALAATIDPAARGWQEAFAPLRADHPENAPAVLAAYRREVERARRFVAERALLELPASADAAPLEVVETPAFFPPGRYPLTGYLGYRIVVTLGGGGEYLGDHCRRCIPPLAVHEGYPGHHAAFLLQRAAVARGGGAAGEAIAPEVAAALAAGFRDRVVHEGWAQYAEVLMLESGYYAGDPAAELAALRLLLFRVTRARVDILLHSHELGAQGAVAALAPFVSPVTARAEVARHLGEPTLKAAYYVGLLQILDLRRRARAERPELTLAQFNTRLAERAMPLADATRLRFGIELAGLPHESLAELIAEAGIIPGDPP